MEPPGIYHSTLAELYTAISRTENMKPDGDGGCGVPEFIGNSSLCMISTEPRERPGSKNDIGILPTYHTDCGMVE
jgi:hypothetical protein